MTSKPQEDISRGAGSDAAWCCLEAKAEMETLDFRIGHDYVPMDVFVDPGTSRQHFRLAPIRARWVRIKAVDDRRSD